MRTNVLEVENLIRNYRKSVIKESEEDVKVLKGISFQVAEGEFVGIMGKSGCGKTTLLKTLGMIDKPTDGTIKFMGEDTSELYGDKLADIRNSKIGFIFQDFYLMDSLSVEENIMLPMIISKQNINKMIAEAKKYAEQFQIEICYFLIFQCEKQICHCCICTCISLCCMRPVHNRHLAVFTYDHITRIKVSVTYFIMLWHTLKSCQKFITCSRIKIFQSIDLTS